ncbi:MAG: vitamin B12-dependent ribonucleotide reductase [Chloroflexota bacterium]
MGPSSRPENRGNPVNATQIARVIFAAAESMGISDRRVIERITSQVIARLDKPRQIQTLPGMEDLVSPPKRSLPLPSDAEIEAMVREILNAEKPAEKPAVPKEVTMETTVNSSTPQATTTAVKLTENARHVLAKRYLQKDKEGNVIETPEEMFRRVARAIAAAETNYGNKADAKRWEDEFYRLMTTLEFLPNSPTLMNAGRELGQLSACFVLPVEDSMESIFDAVKYTALIHQSGGGTGFSFSRLRPENDRVGSTGGVASGPVSFIRAFDTATDVIKQGGMRRGANMGILSVDHPDIMKFITSKEDLSKLTNFNISVALTAEFMEAAKKGEDYDLINPRTGKVVERLNAGEVFNKIVEMAWRAGDPGIVFIDRINRDNPTPQLGKIESTNPCGEQPLLPYESCNLASINLSRMLREHHGRHEVDYAKLAETVRTGIRFLDDVIDVNKFPLPQIAEMTRSTRKIGLGVMGFADMLIMLGIPYDSGEALKTAAEIMRFVNEEALKASAELGEERGVFPAFQGSVYDVPDGPRVRNAARTTIAPTGTLSMIAGCSSGIEPLFALSYTKNILDGAQLVEVNPYFEEAARQGGFYSEDLMQKLAAGEHLREIDGVPEDVRRLFVTAHEITPQWHVKMQAAFQQSTNNAVSKTVNFPQEATPEDVAEVYTLAYEDGLKGITIYRDRSRDAQVLTTGKKEDEKREDGKRTPRRRAKTTTGVTERVTTGCGHLYVTVNSDEQGICEVFSSLGKTGGCAAAQLESTCRLISLALRSGVEVASAVKQLRGIRCPSIAWEDGKSILSCADAIASVLEKHTTGYEGKPRAEDYGLAKNLAGQCPDCSNMLVYQEGCFICPACGYTKC